MGVREAVQELEYLEKRAEQQAMVTPVRTFTTGANRDSEDGKLDYDGFLSPLVLRRYAEYMHRNRRMGDGSIRASDNWQLGIPREAYMKSLWRHFMDVWTLHRAGALGDALEDALCAVLFNTSGLLHELLRQRGQR